MGGPLPPSTRVALQLTGAFGAWLALPAIHLAVMNASSGRAVRFVGAHLLGFGLFFTVHFLTMTALRHALRLPLEGTLASQARWEAQVDLVVYAGLVAAWSLFDAKEHRRRAEVREAQLAMQLSEARLATLTAQLDPHFLFNALNALGATMHVDLERTERLLVDLAELLRASLETEQPTWSLARERAHTERYLDVLEARFGPERLSVSWRIPPEAGPCDVPRFAVQSLVENAVKHNAARRGGLRIVIAATVTPSGLRLVVADDGVGFGAQTTSRGTGRGLARLGETLRLLHGEQATLERGRAAAGGAEVILFLPERLA